MKSFVLILSLFSVLLVGFTEQSVSFVAFYLFFGITPLFILNAKEKIYYTGVFVVNVLITFFIYRYYIGYFGTPYFGGGSDDIRYESDALLFVDRFGIFEYSKIRGGVVPEYHNSVGYIYIVSLIIKISNFVGGYHTLLPRIVNAALLGGVSIMLFRALKNVTFTKKALLIALIVGLSPLQMFISGHIFRDILIEFLLVLIFYVGSRRKISFFQLAIVVTCVAFLWELRNFSAMIGVFVYVIVKYYNSQKLMKSKISKGTVKFGFALISVFTLAIIVPELLVKFNTYFESYSEYRGEELSDGYASLIFKAPLLPFGVCLRILYLLITPIPIFSSNMATNLMQLESVVRILFLPHFFYGLSKAITQKQFEKHYLYLFLVPFIVISLTSFQIRQFTMFYPFYIVILVYGIDKSLESSKFKQLLAFSGMFFTLILLSYLLTK